MQTKPGDIITIESEDGILHSMTVKAVDQNNRTVTGDVEVFETSLLHHQDDRKTIKTVTVPDHSIRYGHQKSTQTQTH